jgi:DNA (cytosine-5)-methyltransferase 1
MVAHALRAEGFDASEGGTGRGTPLVPVVFKVRGGVEREDGSRGSTNIGKQAGKGYLGSEERAFTLAAAQDQFVAQPVAFHNRQDPDVSGDITHPLGAKDNGMAVAQPIPFRKSRRAQSVDDHETWVEDGVSNTLNCFDVGDVRAVDVVAQPVAYGIDGEQNASEELIGTLRSHQSGGYEGARVAQPVAFEPGSIARNAGPVGESPLAPTLRREMGDNQPAVRIDMQVRRLTPVECERLQGFPDGYTNIPWRKKPEAPDGPRYKALGNSMAVPCMAWIGKRIAEVDRGD